MTEHKESADVRRYRKAQEAKTKKDKQDAALIQHLNDKLTELENETEKEKKQG
jgi:hypothetical protein